ncbi:hypothetical protein PLICBS_010090 [Purpureocillium lilacinum]|uniref:uncharacterized protein n=1 Tax=Purpureocillium lilacinum TaxID=33203 RepID=UPI002084BFD4|nr:hypothetical protein PLICBS_010090 [Purpureocillium lilacinum]
MGSPLFKHDELATSPKWAPQDLGTSGEIVGYEQYFASNDSLARDMNGYNTLPSTPRPWGFADTSSMDYAGRFSQPPHPFIPSPSVLSPPQPNLLGTNTSSLYLHNGPFPSAFAGSTYGLYGASMDTGRRISMPGNFVSPGFAEYHCSDETKEKQRCTYPDCGKVLKDLKAHICTHQNERPEKCPMQTCPYHVKGFARKYDKNRHILTHYRGSMVCGFCPGSGSPAEKSFNRADVFKRHLTAVHGVKQAPPNSRKRTPTDVSAGKKLTGYAPDATGKCSTCSQTFSSAQDFYEHLDDCVLRVLQQKGPAETFHAQRLAEVENDKSAHQTLEKNNLPAKTQTAQTEGDNEEDDMEDENGTDETTSRANSFPSTKKKKRNSPNGVQKSRGMTHSHGGVPLATKARGRKNRRNYLSSWGFEKGQMNMKKRIMAVFDGRRRLADDDRMLSTDHEVRPKLSDGKSYVTDLDGPTLKLAEGFLGAIDDEKAPWVSDDPTEEQLKEMKEMLETNTADLKNHEEAKVAKAIGKDQVDDEIPYTDSGYASGINPHILTVGRDADDEEDTRTTYSAATTVGQVHAKNYISELSHHIHSNLLEHVDSEGRSELCRSLPELIKAFAIKIGCESTSQLNLDIMYFIHKHYREIATEIEKLLIYTDDDAPGDARKADPNGMSLLDKMNMWSKNVGLDKPQDDQGELFGGVEDQEEEIIPQVEAPRYNKIILDSSAYNWFITNLRKEYSLQRGPSELRLTIDNIRQTILDKLPPRRVIETGFTKGDIGSICGDLLV